MTPRLLVLDDVEGRIAAAPAMARLRELAEVTVLDRPLGDGDPDALAGVRVLLAIRERTRIDAALLERLPGLELVLQTGGHAYHVDQEAATARGVVVALSRRATMATASVPELTFGLMLAVLRRIHPLAGQLAAGEWPAAMGRTLAGRTLGILGLGRHGRPVARIAAAFGMLALAWDRDPGREYPDDEPVAERLPLDDLLERSDVVSVHLRLSPASTGLLDRDRLARMRPGAILVNTARGRRRARRPRSSSPVDSGDSLRWTETTSERSSRSSRGSRSATGSSSGYSRPGSRSQALSLIHI